MKNRTEHIVRDLVVKYFRKLDSSAKRTDLDLREKFFTVVRSTLEDDRWDPGPTCQCKA